MEVRRSCQRLASQTREDHSYCVCHQLERQVEVSDSLLVTLVKEHTAVSVYLQAYVYFYTIRIYHFKKKKQPPIGKFEKKLWQVERRLQPRSAHSAPGIPAIENHWSRLGWQRN